MFDVRELVGHEYIDGFQDCYWVAREYFSRKYDLELTDYARPKGWHHIDSFNFFTDLFELEGFASVGENPNHVYPGYVLLMSILGKKVDHVAIYVGNGMILHHLYGKASRLDVYDLRWKKRVVNVLCHKNYEDWHQGNLLQMLEMVPKEMRSRYARPA